MQALQFKELKERIAVRSIVFHGSGANLVARSSDEP